MSNRTNLNYSVRIFSIFFGFYLSKYIVQILLEGIETFHWVDAFCLFALFWAWYRFDPSSDDKNSKFSARFDLQCLALGLFIPISQDVISYASEGAVSSSVFSATLNELSSKISTVLSFISTYILMIYGGILLVGKLFSDLIDRLPSEK